MLPIFLSIFQPVCLCLSHRLSAGLCLFLFVSLLLSLSLSLFLFLYSLGVTGILFPSRQEYAFSTLRVWFSTGFTCGFVIALFLDLETQLWIILGIVVLHFVTYSVLILRTQTRKQLLPCCFSKEEEGNVRREPQNL